METRLTEEENKQAKADYGNRQMDAGYRPEHFEIMYYDKALCEAQDLKTRQAIAKKLDDIAIKGLCYGKHAGEHYYAYEIMADDFEALMKELEEGK